MGQDDMNNWFTFEKACMDRIDEMQSLSQMDGVIKDMNSYEYKTSKGAKKVSITNMTNLKEYIQRLFE